MSKQGLKIKIVKYEDLKTIAKIEKDLMVEVDTVRAKIVMIAFGYYFISYGIGNKTELSTIYLVDTGFATWFCFYNKQLTRE